MRSEVTPGGLYALWYPRARGAARQRRKHARAAGEQGRRLSETRAGSAFGDPPAELVLGEGQVFGFLVGQPLTRRGVQRDDF